MSRRAVSLTLLLALLLTQWVNLHRRYDGCAACGRPPAPHVHLSELVPFAERPQSCRCGTHTDPADHGCCNRHASGGAARAALVGAAPAKGCCADVLVLSADAEGTFDKADPKRDSPDSTLDAVGSQAGRAADGDGSTVAWSLRSPPSCPSEPLYLLNRALLL